MADSRDRVDTPSVVYEESMQEWSQILTLLGGTDAMRRARTKYLPMEPAEALEDYEVRIERSFLYPGLKDTIRKYTNKPFSREVTIEELPEKLEYLIDDTDGLSKTLTQLSRELFSDLCKFGLAHILVDYTTIPQINSGEVATLADEQEAGARAFIRRVSPIDLIGWQTDDKSKLTQIRIKETSVEPAGEFIDQTVKRIRVINRDTWQIYRKDESKDRYTLETQGSWTLGKISLVTIYANQKGFMTAESPLQELGDVNVCHWQSSSDQRNILRMSRFAILFGSGIDMTDEDGENIEIKVGPKNFFHSDNPDAKLEYVEITGKSIDAGRADLKDLEQYMEILGMQPLMRKDGSSTATGQKIDANNATCDIKSWIRSLESGLEASFEFVQEWTSIEVDMDKLKIDIFSDFEVSSLDSASVRLLLDSCKANKITDEVYQTELVRRNILHPSTDLEEMNRELQENTQSFMDAINPLEDEEDEDEDEDNDGDS